MDAVDEGEQAGISPQFAAEGVERAQALFGLGHEVGILLEGTEAHGVVDVGNGDTVVAELLAEEHVLVAVAADSLVEGVGEHHLAADAEIGRVEVVVRLLLPLLQRVVGLGGLLVAVAQVAPECLGIAPDAYPSIDDAGFGVGHIFIYKVVVDDGHVAVDEEQPVVLRLTGEEIADGGTPLVGRPFDVATAGQLVDGTVGTDDGAVGRTIVGNEDFIVYRQGLRLLLQLADQLRASPVVGGDQYRDSLHRRAKLQKIRVNGVIRAEKFGDSTEK